MEEISIKINLGGREYPLRIKKDDEVKLRETVEKINSNIKNLEKEFGIKDKQDLLAMTALQLLNQPLQENVNPKQMQELQDQLQSINEMLDGCLSNN